MIISFALVTACSLTPLPFSSISPVADDSLAALYESGKSWPEFLEAAKQNRELWSGNFTKGAPSPAILGRAKAVPGLWRVLAVAEDWCKDSANTIPYIARLTEELPALELRIVSASAGKWVMERHRTRDGRTATPTVLLLGPDFTERGCFIESPTKLGALVAGWKAKLSDAAWHDKKAAWYKADRGRETLSEFVAMMEGAASGTPKCNAAK
jgi:hypothetical protein